MKVEFNTTPKDFEKLNVTLRLATESLENNLRFAHINGISLTDIEKIKKIRLKMVKSFTKSISK